jgi:hypothetical protein
MKCIKIASEIFIYFFVKNGTGARIASDEAVQGTQ